MKVLTLSAKCGHNLYMETTTCPTITITTKDRTEDWDVVGGLTEMNPSVSFGYTHSAIITQARRSRFFLVSVEMIDGQVVRNTTPVAVG